MKVLLLTPGAYGGHGGIAQCNRDFIEAMAAVQEIDEVAVLSRKLDYDVDPAVLPKKVNLIKTSASKISYLLNVIRLISMFRKYDLIICGHVNLVSLAWFVAKRFHAKFYLFAYGVEVWKPPTSFLTKRCLKYSSGVVAISQFTADKLTAWLGKKKTFILPLMVDTAKFFPSKGSQALLNKFNLSGKKMLFTLARLDKTEQYKGIDEVLELMHVLLKQYPSLVYLIAGKGDDKARLEKKAVDLGVDKHLQFIGYVSEAEKVDLYRLTDLFVMPGRGEGFGLVYLEALACGAPVVGSSLDASYETLLQGELGFVPDPRNKNELKQAILSGLESIKGQVPDRLSIYTKKAFKQRVAKIIHTLN